MRIGLSDRSLERLAVYVLKPSMFYLCAIQCWLWLDKPDNFGLWDSIWLVVMVILGFHWGFSAPRYDSRIKYKVFTYILPIILAVSGLFGWYVVYKI